MERLKVKITDRVSLEVLIKGDKILRSRLLKGEAERGQKHPFIEAFVPYLKGEGDVNIGMESLWLEGIRKEVIVVWKALSENTFPGRVITYSELGEITGKHPRFVGYCMRINRFPLIVPCHRVIGKGGLGGFSYGVDIKRELLRFEGLSV